MISADRSQLLSLMSVYPIIICCNGLFLPCVPRRPSRSYKLDRPWRKLNVDDLRAALSTSSMCRPDEWPADVDDMAALYDRQLTAVLNQLIPLCEVTRRP